MKCNIPSPLQHPVGLRADLPVYPGNLQLLRVTQETVAGPSGISQNLGSSILAPPLHVSFTQQLRTDSLLPRDREPCLALGMRGYQLTPGFHVGRLSGSHTSLPVYEVVEHGLNGNVVTPDELQSNTNNLDSGNGSIVRLSADSPIDITGMLAPKESDSNIAVVTNIGTNAITFTHNDSGSDAGNRFSTPDGSSLTLNGGGSLFFWYDPISLRWRIFTPGTTGATGPAGPAGPAGSSGLEPHNPSVQTVNPGSAAVGNVSSLELEHADFVVTNPAANTAGVKKAFGGGKAGKSSAQSVGDSAVTALTFDSEEYDEGGYYDSSQNTRLTIPNSDYNGIHHIGGWVDFAANSTGIRRVFIRENGTDVISEVLVNAAGTGSEKTMLNISVDVSLSNPDYVELMVVQNSGGNLDVDAKFWIHRMGVTR